MKILSAGLFGLLCTALIGCQAKPLTFRNPFALKKPPVDKAVAKAQNDDRNKADDRKRTGKSPRPSDKRGVAKMNPIPESTDLIDDSNRDKANSVEEMWSQAEAALQRGNLAKATAFYREVTRLDPINAAAHQQLARIAVQQKNYQLAEKHYLTAVNLSPNDTSLMNDLGYSYLEQGRLADGERIFHQLLRIDPENSLALRNMGELKAREGKKAEAFDYFRKGGLDYETAERKVIETAGGAAETGVAARRDPKPSEAGLPYSSSTPDWDSRYGVAPVAERRDAAAPTAQTRGLPTPNPGPASREVYGNSAIQQAAGVAQPPAASSTTARGNGDASALERALLNAGPGSLFPASTSGTNDGTGAASDSGNPISPADYQADSPTSAMNPYTTTTNQSASVRIQSPASDTGSYGASPYSLPLTTKARTPAAAPEQDAGYRQFPGRASTAGPSSTDSLHQFEQEIQSDRYGADSLSP